MRMSLAAALAALVVLAVVLLRARARSEALVADDGVPEAPPAPPPSRRVVDVRPPGNQIMHHGVPALYIRR